MTLGEKIKNARRQCGLSQEELSEKLNVSRSAVAKWETDKGLPDIDNLKALAKLLSVSVDYLLDDSECTEETVMREPYDISKYGRGLRKTKKDRVMRENFPDAKIYTLLGEMKLKKGEKVIDNLLGFLTDAPFGVPQIMHGVRNLDRECYLVDKNDSQYFVIVTDEFIETHVLTTRFTEKRFEIGNWKYTNCGPIKNE